MKNDAANIAEPWYIGKVVNINDKAKRRRIQVRGPRESEDAVPDDKLLWIPPFPLSPSDFWLPNVGEPIMILRFGDFRMWIELPCSEDWQDMSDDDYGTAFMHKHHDVLEQTYKMSEGFVTKYVGNIKVLTDSTTLIVTKDNVDFTFNDVHIVTDGSSLTAKVKDVEFSTDGSKATLKNGSQSLADILDRLETALISHTHQGITPTSPPINLADFNKNKADFKQLLQ
jgi:hypothetical protein